MNHKLHNYQAMDILGKSIPELIVKVYDGAISNMGAAVERYRANDFQAGFEAMEQAKKFLVHLYTTLDNEKGGEIADKLSKIYVFVIDQINLVQATKDISRMEDSILVLKNVREGWAQLAAEAKKKPEIAAEIVPTQNAKNVSFSI
jgi:flagellar secretion chaperone FliS